ncbi:SphA family protein [Marinomonas mediterranea]|uniref:Phenol degradation protein meta n=1 Tax=Marinomonas mediterranea (strain ATCC 700492 / JCM 21426 / NBRC 103028 / MMB-1) TaxID=717774 RepID=F2JW38_MARM1|nr:transporter [Marinomonas mediterranea]ADZ92926.1 hypothetical protein Marme_3716 [Marinomonas mediterranea MMB-1]WCN18949.1 phenol degradation protein meta [Marinomonas mediterranea MMB-1]
MIKSRALIATGLMTLPYSVFAYDLPGINLGATSFYDAAPPPTGPGLYFVEYLQFSTANTLNGANGEPLTLPKQDLDVFVPLTQLIYLSDTKIGNASLGFTGLLPYLAKADVDDGLNNVALDSTTGVGDLTLGAFLQFDPVMGTNGPVFSQRVEFDISIPTGEYDSSKAINPSSNSVYINPYYALTYWLSPRWTASTRISYLWNGKNDDPSPTYSNLGATETQAGQAFHINFASAYAVSNRLSVGLSGYVLNQITNTKANGSDVADTKEEVWAIGPGFQYVLNPNNSIVANVYFEQDAKNRAESDRFILRFNHHF